MASRAAWNESRLQALESRTTQVQSLRRIGRHQLALPPIHAAYTNKESSVPTPAAALRALNPKEHVRKLGIRFIVVLDGAAVGLLT